MDKLTSEQRRRNMQANKASGTSIEKRLGKYMWRLGLRYRKNVNTVEGKPDFVFKTHKIAVFCDGEFWHGRNWDKRKADHKSNEQFWHTKIERNIKRDAEVNAKLKNKGWRVLRFWESEINADPEGCAAQVKQVYEETK